MLHYQQHLILGRLLRAQGLKYSELKPADLDKDSYNYHLKFLLTKKYIEKVEELYKLTPIGKKYVQRLDFKGEPKEYFKASIIALVTRMLDGKQQLLLQKRLRHPYYGDYLFGVSGKILPGERLEVAASRKLLEETGLTAEFSFLGVIRKLRYDSKAKLIEDTFYHICLADNFTGELQTVTAAGEHMWVAIEDIEELIVDNITYSKCDSQLISRLFLEKDLTLFYWTEEVNLKKF